MLGDIVRRTVKQIILSLLVLTALAVAAPNAYAEGYFITSCPVSHTSNADPIRETDNAHEATRGTVPAHTFFGNTSTVATSTVTSLQAGSSTCNIPSFKVTGWIPTMISPTGQVVLPYAIDYRIQNLGGPVQRTPEGLSFIFGNPMNLNPNATAAIWACTGVANNTQPQTIPPSCPVGAKGVHASIYPHRGCWNGTQLGPGLYRGDGPADAFSHIAGTQACPTGTRFPAITVVPKYPPEAIGGHLASDASGQVGGTTLHLDEVFVDGLDSQGRSFAERTRDMCLNFVPDNGDGNTGETCRVVTNIAAPGGKELRRLSDGAQVLDGGTSTTPPPPPPPPPPGFDDPFDGTTLDTAKWDVVSGTPTVAGGLCRLDNGDAVGTKVPFALTGKTVTAYGWGMRQMLVRDTSYAGNAIDLKRIGGNLITYSPNGAPQQTIPYDPVAHANLRVREAGGTVYWEASPDGMAWSVLRSFPTPAWVATRDATLRFLGAPTSEAALDSTVSRATIG